jgi:hypothetical protein
MQLLHIERREERIKEGAVKPKGGVGVGASAKKRTAKSINLICQKKCTQNREKWGGGRGELQINVN